MSTYFSHDSFDDEPVLVDDEVRKPHYVDEYEPINYDDLDGVDYSIMFFDSDDESFSPPEYDFDYENTMSQIYEEYKSTGNPFEDLLLLCELYKKHRLWKEANKIYIELLEKCNSVYAARRIVPCISRCFRAQNEPRRAFNALATSLRAYGNEIITQEYLTTLSAVLKDINENKYAELIYFIAEQSKTKNTEHLPNLAMRLFKSFDENDYKI